MVSIAYERSYRPAFQSDLIEQQDRREAQTRSTSCSMAKVSQYFISTADIVCHHKASVAMPERFRPDPWLALSVLKASTGRCIRVFQGVRFKTANRILMHHQNVPRVAKEEITNK